MAIFRWGMNFDPFAGLRHVQRELEQLHASLFGESRRVGGGTYPPVNVYDSAEEVRETEHFLRGHEAVAERTKEHGRDNRRDSSQRIGCADDQWEFIGSQNETKRGEPRAEDDELE